MPQLHLTEPRAWQAAQEKRRKFYVEAAAMEVTDRTRRLQRAMSRAETQRNSWLTKIDNMHVSQSRLSSSLSMPALRQ